MLGRVSADYARMRLVHLASFLLLGLPLALCVWLASASYLAVRRRWWALGRWAAGPLGLTLLIPRALIAAALPVLQLTAGHAPRAPAGIADGLLLWSALVWLVGMIVLRRTLARPIVAAADAAR